MNPEQAVIALKRIELSQVAVSNNFSEEVEQEIEDAKERQSRFHFADYTVSAGSVLVYTRDPLITAEVLANDKIKIGDKVGSLSQRQEIFCVTSVDHKVRFTLNTKERF